MDPGDSDRSEASAELTEAIERFGAAVEQLCEQRGEGRGSDPEQLNAAFRGAHSLKGLAGLFGEPALAELAHAAEDLLDGLRLGRLALADEVEDLLLDLPPALVGALDAGSGGRLSRELVRRVHGLVTESAAVPRPALPPPAVPPELRALLTTYEEHRVSETLGAGHGLYVVAAQLPLATFDHALRALRDQLAPLGELLATLPSTGEASAFELGCDLLLGSALSRAELQAALPAALALRELRAAAPERAIPPPRPQHSVRIDLRQLEGMMEIMGDLTLVRLSLTRIAGRLQVSRTPALAAAEILQEARRLERRVELLQSQAVAARMVPLAPLFSRARRLAERVAGSLGKEVEVLLEGGEVEIDKVLAEALAEPLVHLVHNAVDHGIERPEVREARGKPRRGFLRLRATQRAGMVMLDVSDDGAGIDATQVRRAAEARGLLATGQGDQLAHRDLVRLLLTPGFSTTAEVSRVSGRGVGLDAVREKVVGFAGFLEVDSELGQGSTFTVAMPATLALVRSLVVRVRDHTYALPVSAVWEITALPPDHGRTHRLASTEEQLPLVALSDLFGLGGTAAPRPVAAIVGPPDRRVGLVLDALEGQRDLVMKPLGVALGRIPGVSGLAQLGPGQPVLVLDVSALTDEALQRPGLRGLR